MKSPRSPRAILGTAVLAALGASLLAAAPAAASPHPLPFSYPYATLPAGALEGEQYVDLIPIRVERELDDGTTDAVTSVRSLLQTELEYGITDRLELALYFAFRQGGSADTPLLRFQGLKQRLRYRFAQEGELPVDIGVYFEVAEFHDEFELEEKLLLSRRFGRLNATVNLWVEQEYYFQTEETKFIYNPTAGVSYEVSPAVSLGLEYWARGRFDDPDDDAAASAGDSPSGTVHYAGPTLLLQGKTAFVSVGVYGRMDKLGSGLAVGDQYGKLWVRTLVGIDL